MKSCLSRVICAFIFLTSPAAYAAVIDFDGLTPGDLVTTLGGVTFSSNIVGYDLIASSGFDTTSSSNYLAVDDGGFEVFLPGDVITLDFATPINSLSVSFISTPSTPGNAFEISTSVGSATSGAAPDSILGDGGEVFMVLFSSATAFNSADLLTPILDVFSFNVDDIVYNARVPGGDEPLPLPPVIWLFMPALLLAWRRGGRRLR